MRWLFPYNSVGYGSRIVLYGFGECGKDFWLQLHFSMYCRIVAWVDRSFDGYELDKPFDYVENIQKHEYDYIVLAVSQKGLADSIKKELILQGIDSERIVWSIVYHVNSTFFPQNKCMALSHFSFYENLIDETIESENQFVIGRYYQSLKKLGIAGVRNNDERVLLYNVPQLLDKSMKAVEIGCNCGFFDLSIAPYVGEITGVDIDQNFVNIANRTSAFLNMKNVNFVCGDAFEFLKKSNGFDVLFSLGVYRYILENGISEQEYFETIYDSINDEGLLFFESHPLERHDNLMNYRKVCQLFSERMDMIMNASYNSLGDRIITVFKKTDQHC